MDKKDKIVFEDLAVQGNRWQQDPSGKIHNSRQLSLLDLVKMAKPDQQHPNFVPASQTPLHGSQNFLEHAIVLVQKSPVLADRPGSKAELQKMLKKCAFIKKLITNIGEDIDNFSVEKPAN
mgnify:CR=1 FL=1